MLSDNIVDNDDDVDKEDGTNERLVDETKFVSIMSTGCGVDVCCILLLFNLLSLLLFLLICYLMVIT